MLIKTKIDNEALEIEANFLPYSVDGVEINAVLDKVLEETDFAFISEESSMMNGLEYNEGNLILNTDINLKAKIDIDGSLNISSKSSDNFYIDEEGNLIKKIL